MILEIQVLAWDRHKIVLRLHNIERCRLSESRGITTVLALRKRGSPGSELVKFPLYFFFIVQKGASSTTPIPHGSTHDYLSNQYLDTHDIFFQLKAFFSR